MVKDIKVNIDSTYLNAVQHIDFSEINIPDFIIPSKNKVEQDTEEIVIDIEVSGTTMSYCLGLKISEPMPHEVSEVTSWFSKNIEDKDDLLSLVYEFDLNLCDILKNINFTEAYHG